MEGREIMRKAFHDALADAISTNTHVQWLTDLHREIRSRLLACVPVAASSTRQRIEVSMNTELFNQMISNEAFNAADLVKLVRFTFDTVKDLQAPFRDEETALLRDEVETLISSGKAWTEIVPTFVLNSNLSIDMIENDLYVLTRVSEQTKN